MSDLTRYSPVDDCSGMYQDDERGEYADYFLVKAELERLTADLAKYGKDMTEAADAIECLTAQLALSKDAEALGWQEATRFEARIKVLEANPDYPSEEIEGFLDRIKVLETIRCQDNAGGHHRWDGDGQCLDCCNYATDLIDAIAAADKEDES